MTNNIKKKQAIISFNRLCSESPILDSFRASIPNAAYIDPICEYANGIYAEAASNCENIASSCDSLVSEDVDSSCADVDSVSEHAAPVNAYVKIDESLEIQVTKPATLFVPFLDTEFTRDIIQDSEMRESFYGYLNHLHDEEYKVNLYVPNVTEFKQNFPELSKGIKINLLDMKSVAPRTHFPTQNTTANTVVHGMVALLFLCMLRIVLQPERKSTPRLRC